MKKLVIILVAVFGLFIMNACDEDLLDVTETIEFEETFIVFSDEASYADSQLFDLAENVDLIKDYGNKIKEVVIEEASFWIKDLNGTEGQMLQSGSLYVSNADGSGKTALISLGEHLLADLVETPTDVTLEQAGVDKLDALASAPPHSFMLHYEADFNEAPLDFKVVFKFKAKMVANPLN